MVGVCIRRTANYDPTKYTSSAWYGQLEHTDFWEQVSYLAAIETYYRVTINCGSNNK